MSDVEDGAIATSAGPLAIRSIGPADARALLWVHGYTLDSSIWEPIWRRLPGFRHIGLDLPGHGLSRDFGVQEVGAAFATALLAVADACGADALIGLSFGGMVCLQAIAAHPSRFAHAVLCAPALPGGPEDQDAADCNQHLLRLHGERGAGPWLSERWLESPPHIFTGARRHPRLFAHLAHVAGRHRWGELAAPGFAPRSGDLIAKLAKANIRALLLLGEDDLPSFIRTADLLRRRLRWPVCFVPDAGHLSILEQPDVCAALIEDFLSH